MATAGYSGTPLFKKLGIKPETKLLLINEPVHYTSLLGNTVHFHLCHTPDVPDIIHLFVKTINEFDREMKKLKSFCKKNPAISIWVSWYKRSAKIPTDVTEDVIRSYALLNGLVDVKVCAVDEQWSGLKLVVPLKNR